MTNDPKKHHRHSIRLKDYDYSEPGAYFVTICTHNRQHLFGQILDGRMGLNEWGKIVYEEWFASMKICNEIKLFENEFVVMPNHIHGIVWIVGADNEYNVGANIVGATDRYNVGTNNVGATDRYNVGTNNVGATGRSPLRNGPKNKSLSSFIAGFKSAVTKQINIIRQTPGTPFGNVIITNTSFVMNTI